MRNQPVPVLLAFLCVTGPAAIEARVQRTRTMQELRQLTDDPAFDYHPVFSPAGGEILFTSRDSGRAALFRVPTTGGARQRVPIERTGDLYSDWAPDGRSIVFDAREDDGPPDIFRFWFESGEIRQLTDHPGMDGHPSFSPAGDRIVFTTMRAGNQDIWIMDADGSNAVRLTRHPADDWHPQWSPIGDRILFTSSRDGDPDLWTIRTDGRDLRKLTSLSGGEDRGSWSPDGSRIVFQWDGDLWLVGSGAGTPERLTDFAGREGNPAWSPDGRWIAFVSDRTGHNDIWLLTPHTMEAGSPTGDRRPAPVPYRGRRRS